MIYLFSKVGKRFLKILSKKSVLYSFDYDGTLAPLTRDIHIARIPDFVEKELILLNHLSDVAIISGRGLSSLKKLLDFKPSYLIGNHGAEGLKINNFSPQKSKTVSKKWLREILTHKLEKGVEIEDKDFSLSLHYRKSRKRQSARRQLISVVKELKPQPRVIFGKSVINLVPSFAPNKGDAVLVLLKKSKRNLVVYVGDDITDEDVFRVKDRRIVGIKVGRSRHSAAKYYIKSRAQMVKLLTFFLKV